MELSALEVSDLLNQCGSTAAGSADAMVNYRDLAAALVRRIVHASNDSHNTHIRQIERGKRLSTCMLWKLQELWYEQAGPQAWGIDAVPSYFTSNSAIARTYALLVAGWLRDAILLPVRQPGTKALDLSQPVYIVELGGGCTVSC